MTLRRNFLPVPFPPPRLSDQSFSSPLAMKAMRLGSIAASSFFHAGFLFGVFWGWQVSETPKDVPEIAVTVSLASSLPSSSPPDRLKRAPLQSRRPVLPPQRLSQVQRPLPFPVERPKTPSLLANDEKKDTKKPMQRSLPSASSLLLPTSPSALEARPSPSALEAPFRRQDRIQRSSLAAPSHPGGKQRVVRPESALKLASSLSSPEALRTLARHPIFAPRPPYPRWARVQGWEGDVLLWAQIAANGEVVAVVTSQTSGYRLLDRAAEKAVLRWRFPPFHKESSHSKETRRELEIPVRFFLNQE